MEVEEEEEVCVAAGMDRLRGCLRQENLNPGWTGGQTRSLGEKTRTEFACKVFRSNQFAFVINRKSILEFICVHIEYGSTSHDIFLLSLSVSVSLSLSLSL